MNCGEQEGWPVAATTGVHARGPEDLPAWTKALGNASNEGFGRTGLSCAEGGKMWRKHACMAQADMMPGVSRALGRQSSA